MDFKVIKAKLNSYNMEYLLHFYNKLTDSKKEILLQDIQSVNFEYMKNLAKKADNIDKTKEQIEPLKGKCISDFSEDEIKEISSVGRDIICSGKYAVLTLAGGQGTRLGIKGPKGTLKLNLKDKKKYIFELLTNKLLKAREKYGIFIPWYIMTSVDNNYETVNFFQKNNYFGYPKEKITFFIQSELPITDLDGNILLEKEYKILKASDGNGGVFKALETCKIIDKLKEEKIEWILFSGVDNILVNYLDEFFIGYTKKDNKENGVKSIARAYPEEKIGAFCKRNGRPSVIEYSELTEEMKYSRDSNGMLRFIEGNMLNHLINIKVLEKIGRERLPYHKAIKKISYIDKEGNFVNPNDPCLIKYEALIFDYLKYVNDVTIFRVDREKEFAPIKNKEGIDSPQTAIELYNKLNE